MTLIHRKAVHNAWQLLQNKLKAVFDCWIILEILQLKKNVP